MNITEIEAYRKARIPAGAIALKSKKSPTVVYLFDNVQGQPAAKLFFGNALKPTWFYRFPSVDARYAYVAKMMAKQDEAFAYKQAQKAEKKAKLAEPQTQYKVGDVLYSSWGYDQTNIDFYEVVELVGKRGIKIREIASERTATEFMSGRATPKKGVFMGEAMLKRVDERGTVKINSFASAWKLAEAVIDGVVVGYESKMYTSYA